MEYACVVDPLTLEEQDGSAGGDAFVALVAATFDGVRLIDNIEFSVKEFSVRRQRCCS